MDRLRTSIRQSLNWFDAQPTLNKIGLICAISLQFWLAILAVWYHEKIISFIVSTADDIRDSGYKGVLAFTVLLSLVSFPPLIGFSSLVILIGIVYGFRGFLLVTTISSIMSTASLSLFKYYFQSISQKIIDSHENLQLFTSVIKDSETSFVEEVFILTLMKLCPLPYSLTNGGLGCVPGISPLAFFLACLLCSPKYFIQLFMGIQLRKINDDKTNSSKVLDFTMILVTLASFATLSTVLYSRLKLKIQQRQNSPIAI